MPRLAELYQSIGADLIHYHGTPITPRSELMKLAGKNFCVSFANTQDADWCLSHGQSVLFDNGAFSAHTKGRPFNPEAYCEWLGNRLAHPNWAIIPDVIDGDVDCQRDLLKTWNFNRELSAPVWHLGLPIDWLLELANNWPRLCFGSSAKYWQVGSSIWERRVDEAFNAMERRGLRPWVHMLRGMAMAGDRWPFASADSANVARNYKDQKICPERMARRIDAIQTPVRWYIKETQQELIL